MSAFCNLCHRDADTGEYFCARIGKWVEMCPNFPRRLSVEGIKGEEKDTSQDNDEDEN